MVALLSNYGCGCRLCQSMAQDHNLGPSLGMNQPPYRLSKETRERLQANIEQLSRPLVADDDLPF